MEEGLRFRGWEKGASGEKVIWRPRGMNGGELGGEWNHVLRTHLSEM